MSRQLILILKKTQFIHKNYDCVDILRRTFCESLLYQGFRVVDKIPERCG